MNRYPTEQELEKIEKWPHNNFIGLMNFICGIWEFGEWGWSEKKLKDAIKYDISTGGWSGNEDIIRALEQNHLFWAMCWVQSRKGGHYIFHVR